MVDKTQNQEMAKEHEKPTKLNPVNGRFRKILSVGTKIVVGGTVIAFVISLITPRRTMGVTRSARLEYEQHKMQVEKAIEEETKEERGIVTNESTARQ